MNQQQGKPKPMPYPLFLCTSLCITKREYLHMFWRATIPQVVRGAAKITNKDSRNISNGRSDRTSSKNFGNLNLIHLRVAVCVIRKSA